MREIIEWNGQIRELQDRCRREGRFIWRLDVLPPGSPSRYRVTILPMPTSAREQTRFVSIHESLRCPPIVTVERCQPAFVGYPCLIRFFSARMGHKIFSFLHTNWGATPNPLLSVVCEKIPWHPRPPSTGQVIRPSGRGHKRALSSQDGHQGAGPARAARAVFRPLAPSARLRASAARESGLKTEIQGHHFRPDPGRADPIPGGAHQGNQGARRRGNRTTPLPDDFNARCRHSRLNVC